MKLYLTIITDASERISPNEMIRQEFPDGKVTAFMPIEPNSLPENNLSMAILCSASHTMRSLYMSADDRNRFDAIIAASGGRFNEAVVGSKNHQQLVSAIRRGSGDTSTPFTL
jgi:hypothetical protein